MKVLRAIRWPRWTTRRTMFAVAGFAMVLGLVWPAVEILRTPEFHVHVWVKPGVEAIYLKHGDRYEYPNAISDSPAIRTPFWHRYLSRLAGPSWAARPCGASDPSRLIETCECAYPGMIERDIEGRVATIRYRPEISAEAIRRYPKIFEHVGRASGPSPGL